MQQNHKIDVRSNTQLYNGNFTVEGFKDHVTSCSNRCKFYTMQLEEGSVARHQDDRKIRTSEEEPIPVQEEEEDNVLDDIDEEDDSSDNEQDNSDTKTVTQSEPSESSVTPEQIVDTTTKQVVVTESSQNIPQVDKYGLYDAQLVKQEESEEEIVDLTSYPDTTIQLHRTISQ